MVELISHGISSNKLALGWKLAGKPSFLRVPFIAEEASISLYLLLLRV
jgi:hypothetical protein